MTHQRLTTQPWFLEAIKPTEQELDYLDSRALEFVKEIELNHKEKKMEFNDAVISAGKKFLSREN